MQKLSDQNPGLQISLYYPHGKDFFLGAKTKIKKVDSEKNDVKVVNMVFFQYRNARTLEIEGHFCPVIDMKKFVATKYLLKQPKNKVQHSKITTEITAKMRTMQINVDK